MASLCLQLLVLIAALCIFQASSQKMDVRTLPDSIPTPEELKDLEKGFVLKQPPASDFPGKTPQPKDSGKDGNTVNSQIVGGVTVARGSFPWQVNLIMDSTSMCGGSLVSGQWVLTAAHCLFNRLNVDVTVGAQDLSVFEDGRITIQTTQKVVHSGYNAATLANDIAMIKFPITLTLPNIWFKSIRLPRQSQTTLTFENVVAVACGRGKIANNAASVSYLNCVAMTVISNTLCAQIYGSSILASTLCTSTNNAGVSRSICQGDSGGPLAIKEADGLWTLIGVASFVHGNGCQSLKPAGFARVTSFLPWISFTSGIAIMP